MKILIAADIFPPQPGGPATYVVALANELTKIGDDVVVVSLNPEADDNAVICNAYHTKYKNKLLRYFHYLLLLAKHSKSADVVYAMGPVNAGLPALVVSKLKRKNLVVKVVGDYAWEQGVQRYGVKGSIDEFQKRKNYSFNVRILKFIQKFVVRHANSVVVPSKYLKGIVVGWGLSWHCVQVIYNSSNFKDFVPREKPKDEKWIISVGRLVSWKGMDILIDVVSDIAKTIPNLKLKILGDGPELDKLRLKVKDQKLENIVDLPGAMPRNEVLSYLSASDIFVLNSAYEGLSHVMLEALHLGIPVLASNKGGNPELILPGKNGNLFELNNKEEIKKKIFKFLGNQPLADLTGSLQASSVQGLLWSEKEKQEFFDQFSLEKMVGETKEVLRIVCKR